MPTNYSSKYEDSNGLTIYTQNDEQQKIARRIISYVRKRWKPLPYYYHLKPGGHVAAVRLHLEHLYFARADLKKFFNNATRRKIERALGKLGINYEIIQEITANSIVTDHSSNNKHVPFGFVQSPLLATLALHKSALGSYFKKVSTSTIVTLSVYMDDILISSNSIEDLNLILDKMLEASQISKFPINPEKLVRPTDSLTIFNIKLSHRAMCLTPDRLAEFETAIRQESEIKVINGIISYVRAVNEGQYLHLKTIFEEVLQQRAAA